MEKKIYTKHDDWKTMSSDDQALLKTAIGMLDISYAPYSGFNVGAAVRNMNGNTYKGCNQENASYPLCICGERVALFNAGANEEQVRITDLAIVVRHQSKPVDTPATPCGACRQVISEFEQRGKNDIRILLKADGPEIYEFKSIKDLLPYSFDSSFL